VAQDDSDEFDHRNTLPFVIVRLGPVLQQTFAEAIAREGLTVRHFGVLVQFAGGRPMTAAAIARALQARVTAHMSPAQRRTMLDQLREMAERAQRRRDDDG
jgi:hypothetical protein